jgi:hypothetical protein
MTTQTTSLTLNSKQTDWSVGQRRFLYWAVSLSILSHLLQSLAWNFSTEPAADSHCPSEIEVIMVNAQTDSAPALARLFAQIEFRWRRRCAQRAIALANSRMVAYLT